MRVIGVLVAITGISVLMDSFARFALKGLGTPAPVFPTRHLVVSGLYRYMRYPMYLAVVAVIVGQGLFFADLRVIGYGLFAWLVCHLFVVAYERPTLRATFGTEYEDYCANVSRWLPRLHPWHRPD